jgi:transglutaminase-like putative cysteine protease
MTASGPRLAFALKTRRSTLLMKRIRITMMGEGQHGATHAWTEIYIPGAGWRGFDPINNKLAGFEHVSVAVAREHEKASPLSGTWDGPPDAFDRMEVSVQVI